MPEDEVIWGKLMTYAEFVTFYTPKNAIYADIKYFSVPVLCQCECITN